MALPPPTRDSAVLVTGASAGIGEHLARRLAARGYGLVLAARRDARLQALRGELEQAHGVVVTTEAVDLADADARDALVGRLRAEGGREITGVCNNAGFGSIGPAVDVPLERDRRMLRLNVEALQQLTQAFLPRMVEQGVGAVLNVASTAAHQPVPGMAGYAATKAFVQSYSEAVHAELEGTGVSVTTLVPGFTRTEFGVAAGGQAGDTVAPEALIMDPGPVAEAGIEGMVAGRRTVVPGPANRIAILGGRLVPRTLLLPALVRANRGRLTPRSRFA
jgi:short-subunit dehydrogenase